MIGLKNQIPQIKLKQWLEVRVHGGVLFCFVFRRGFYSLKPSRRLLGPDVSIWGSFRREQSETVKTFNSGIKNLNFMGFMGFLGGSVGKESACKAGDMGLIPGLRRSPGGGNGNPL